MSKSLKDIVEDGFARLAALSEKRKELLARCNELDGGESSRPGQQGLQKLESTELSYCEEINSHVERSREVLQQTLAQIVEDNERFLAGVKENLQLRIARVIKELVHSREWLLSEAVEHLDSSVRPLERELEAGATDLRLESIKLAGELDAICKRHESSLHEAQAEIASKLSGSERESIGALGTEFSQLVQESVKRRQNVTESLEKLYSEQSTILTKLTEELDERISLIVGKNLSTVKELGKTAEKQLDTVKEEIVAKASAEIVSSSQESLSELEASYEFSNHELSNKLTDLKGQNEQLVEQVRQFLSELESTVRKSCETIFNDAKNRPAEVSDEAPSKGPLDDAIRQVSRELDMNVADFKRQLNELLRLQSERLSNLCAATENSISATSTALNTELKQMTRLYEQTWSEREQEFLSRLRKLEKDTQETSSQVAGTGLLNDGGSV